MQIGRDLWWGRGRPLNPWSATLAPWPAPEPLAGPCTHEAVRGSPGLTGNSTRCPVTACDSRTAPLWLFWDSLKLQCLNKFGQQVAVGIWVSYVTSCYVTSCSFCPGSSVALGGGEGEWGGGGKQWGCCGGQE